MKVKVQKTHYAFKATGMLRNAVPIFKKKIEKKKKRTYTVATPAAKKLTRNVSILVLRWG